MLDHLLSLIAPHSCYGCGLMGYILCQKCKNYINNHPYVGCVLCGQTATSNQCHRHALPYQALWCVAARRGVVARLIDDYKFHHRRAAAEQLAALLAARLPELPPGTVVVPVPTVAHHVRQRGYDHMWLIARSLARQRGWRTARLLRRQTNIVQHHASSATVRRQQAKQFFRLQGCIDSATTYLVVDDIFTTGATLGEAAACLRVVGASRVAAAVIARQGTPRSTTKRGGKVRPDKSPAPDRAALPGLVAPADEEIPVATATREDLLVDEAPGSRRTPRRSP